MPSEYATEEQTVEDTPTFTLHPVRGVVWAAFWGSPIAAGIVMAINYSRMGKKTAARTAIVIGALGTVALSFFGLAIPAGINIPGSWFWVPPLVVAYSMAKAFQGDCIRAHLRTGGAVASGWPSVGIGLLCLPFVLGAIFGIAILLEPSLGTVVEFGNDEIYYSGDASEEDARELARVLKEMEYFGSGGVTVRLESSSAQYVVSFVLVNDAWDDPEAVDGFRQIGRTLAESGFPSPLTIQLCDDYLSAQETFVIK